MKCFNTNMDSNRIVQKILPRTKKCVTLVTFPLTQSKETEKRNPNKGTPLTGEKVRLTNYYSLPVFFSGTQILQKGGIPPFFGTWFPLIRERV
mmetsp:Transcript_54643/g.65750  ORF Transcript_54643/g.65750 Transcript_54643/m.65750 type:complete len:93 (-) Transcript_54643:63-341(-)